MPQNGTMLSEIVRLAAEIECMKIKQEDVGAALSTYYELSQH